MSDEIPRVGLWPPWMERWVLPYLQERGLWPILVALVGHVVVVLAMLILALAREPGVKSFVWLALVGGVTAAGVVGELKRRGRPGGVTGLLAVTWMLGFGLAWVADVTGVY